MRIRIDLKIFIFAILFYLTKQIEIYALLMIFALLHEFGHLIAGLLLDFKPERMNIMPMGVSISFKVDIKDYNKKIQNSNILSVKKIIIALSGPIMNILLAILFMCIDFNLNEIQRLNIIYANILIFIFNLLPIYPLDRWQNIKTIYENKIWC